MSKSNSSPWTYALVFVGLVLLTEATVGLSYASLHAWHTPLGLAIAALKAGLITVFFMHVLRRSRLSWLAIFAGAFWLGILLVLTLSDFQTRDWPM